MTFKSVAIATRYGSRLARDIANIVSNLLIRRGSQVYTIKPLSLDNSIVLDDGTELLKHDINLIIAIGGDGTTLRAIRWVDGEIPVFSIRIKGSRGILADVNTDSIHESIEMIYSNRFYIDERNRIYAVSDTRSSLAAVNEIMITKSSMNVTPNYEIEIDDHIIRSKMDGVIFSTATGSSGYSYSFGGPILYEKSRDIVMTPIASINRLPIIIIPDQRISIRCDSECSIFVDGQHAFNTNKPISVERYHKNARFLRIKKRGLSHLAKLGY